MTTHAEPKFFPLISRSKNAALKQPKEIASFSRTSEGTYALDDSSLSYYYLPDADVGLGNIDLAQGITAFKQFDESRDGEMVGMLQSLQQFEAAQKQRVAVDIITFRGIMTKLLTLPYDQYENGVDLRLVKFDGQIFIQQHRSAVLKKQKMEALTQTPQNKRTIFSGYKFEAVATLDKPWGECTRKEIESRQRNQVSNYEQYCAVVKTGIGKVKYCIGGEVDCCWNYKPTPEESRENGDDPLSHYVELKTANVISKPNQAVNFEKKLYKTWAQCFLLGIRKIVYGFRDERLILRSVEEFQTEKIPLLIKNNPLHASDQKKKNIFMDSLKFYSALLEFVVDHVSEDNSYWSLTYDPKSNKDYVKLVRITDEAEVAKQFALEDTDDIDVILTKDFKTWRLHELPNITIT